MEHYYYLGCNEDDCCVIESLVRITDENIAEVLPFCDISSTDWCGRDKISRTCKLKGFVVVGAPIDLKKSYTHRYEDYDNGSLMTGSFSFSQLQEVVKLPQTPPSN